MNHSIPSREGDIWRREVGWLEELIWSGMLSKQEVYWRDPFQLLDWNTREHLLQQKTSNVGSRYTFAEKLVHVRFQCPVAHPMGCSGYTYLCSLDSEISLHTMWQCWQLQDRPVSFNRWRALLSTQVPEMKQLKEHTSRAHAQKGRTLQQGVLSTSWEPPHLLRTPSENRSEYHFPFKPMRRHLLKPCQEASAKPLWEPPSENPC